MKYSIDIFTDEWELIRDIVTSDDKYPYIYTPVENTDKSIVSTDSKKIHEKCLEVISKSRNKKSATASSSLN